MVLLSEIQKYIKTLKLADMCYIGRIDANKNNIIGIYNREKTTHKTIGDAKTYDRAALTMLIHGTTSKSATENFAYGIYTKMQGAYGKIGKKKIMFVDLLNDAPIDIDQDSAQVYEYTIDFDIYVER